MKLDPALVVLLHRDPGLVAEGVGELEALQVEVASGRVLLLQPHARRLQVERRRFGSFVANLAGGLARLACERDDVVVAGVAESDTSKSGQRVALAAHIPQLARNP
jgi:hypothetical protein